MTKCPDCGASPLSNEGCEEKFQSFLALEYSDPDYGVVHHLTVCAYMLQHPSRLSRTGWLEMRDLLARFLIGQLDPAEFRVRNRKYVSNQNRSWSFTKGPRQELPVEFTWIKTILSVDSSTAAQYRSGIEQWARQVLDDAPAIN